MSARTRIGAAAVIALAVTLCGCATPRPTPDQQAWLDAVEHLDGIESVDLEYDDGGLNGPGRDELTIILSADLTVAHARRISEESCRRDAHFTRIDLTTAQEDPAARTVSQSEVSGYDESCISPVVMESFAHATAAMRDLPRAVDVEFYLYGFEPSAVFEAPVPQRPDSPFFMQATATDRQDLITALAPMHERLRDHPLTYYGDVVSTGTAGAEHDRYLVATLSPDADIALILPLLEHPFALAARTVTVTESALSIEVESADQLGSPLLADLRTLSESAGIAFDARAGDL